MHGLFRHLTVRGVRGSIVWGHRTAATLAAWRIHKEVRDDLPPLWTLSARVAQADAFQCRQRPLLFTAPRDKGLWCWGIEELTLAGDALRARLGPPEH
jgi:hypothetical protein